MTECQAMQFHLNDIYNKIIWEFKMRPEYRPMRLQSFEVQLYITYCYTVFWFFNGYKCIIIMINISLKVRLYSANKKPNTIFILE